MSASCTLLLNAGLPGIWSGNNVFWEPLIIGGTDIHARPFAQMQMWGRWHSAYKELPHRSASLAQNCISPFHYVYHTRKSTKEPPPGDNSLFAAPHPSRDSICALNFEWTSIQSPLPRIILPLDSHFPPPALPFGEYKITLLTVEERWERGKKVGKGTLGLEFPMNDRSTG